MAIVTISLGALALFAKVGEDGFEHESGRFDDAIRGRVLAHQMAWLYRVFLAVTYAGPIPVTVTPAAVTAAWLWWGG